MQIELLDAAAAEKNLLPLIALLQDGVNSGASIGFWPPLSEDEARKYWQGVIGLVASGDKVLLAAFEGDSLTGSVQLELAAKQNAAHRAEVQKLIVHTRYRNRGIASALMRQLEQEAASRGRILLVLDTKQGDAAEPLYHKLGYTEAGVVVHYIIEADGSYTNTVYFYKELPR